MELLKKCAEKLGIILSAHQLDLFEKYFNQLYAWNQKINLTSVTGYEEVQTTHFLDSLTLLMTGKIRPDFRIADIGSGAGLPGIPLKIAMPDISLTLIEATGKKVTFLRSLIEELGLKDTAAITGRAEDLAHDLHYREKYDVVVSRAVASLPALNELCLPFCKIGGTFIAPKKREKLEEELAASTNSLKRLGGRFVKIEYVEVPDFLSRRALIVIDKGSLTPSIYPRRSGMPQKNPL
ncbi:MAG: 16S rRNA (guanine(527)-N(7))-methyltransferase RsmG [Dehalococcoidia bacterium]|nr:16S rRNA (guanine(527)-N(7))-methyltransferase RsmG [Dehalococcoidia bacterium]